MSLLRPKSTYLQGQLNETVFPPRIALRVVIFVILLFWIAAFSNLIFTGKAGFLYPAAKRCFSLVCHQNPSKSFSSGGILMMICARCTGIYIGAAASSLITLFFREIRMPGLKYFFAASVPLAADVVLYHTGLYVYNKAAALITGIIWGSVVFIFILTAIEKYFYTNE